LSTDISAKLEIGPTTDSSTIKLIGRVVMSVPTARLAIDCVAILQLCVHVEPVSVSPAGIYSITSIGPDATSPWLSTLIVNSTTCPGIIVPDDVSCLISARS
jgi:hypothetical protein